MSAVQLPLALPARTALGRDAFFVSTSNAAALAMVDDWANWPGGKLAVTGGAGSGKTHLAHVWAEATGAPVIEAAALTEAEVPALAAGGFAAVEGVDALAELDDPRPPEAALFHLHNMLAATGGRLLVTGQGAPLTWRLATADLASRLQSAAHVALGAPDDALLMAVIVKVATDRQMEIDPRLPEFLARRLDRSLSMVARTVETLDAAALARRRRITVPFARDVLGL